MTAAPKTHGSAAAAGTTRPRSAGCRAAVAAVRAGEPQSYEREWRRLGWRHELLTHGLLAATRHRGLRTRVVPAASVLPGVFTAAVNQLARPA